MTQEYLGSTLMTRKPCKKKDFNVFVSDVILNGPMYNAGIRVNDYILTKNYFYMDHLGYFQDESEDGYDGKWADIVFARSVAIWAGISESGLHVAQVFKHAAADNNQKFVWIDSAVKVIKVDEGSPAAVAGIKCNDRILLLNGQEIIDMESFNQAVFESPKIGRQSCLMVCFARHVDLSTFCEKAVQEVCPENPSTVVEEVCPETPPLVVEEVTSSRSETLTEGQLTEGQLKKRQKIFHDYVTASLAYINEMNQL